MLCFEMKPEMCDFSFKRYDVCIDGGFDNEMGVGSWAVAVVEIYMNDNNEMRFKIIKSTGGFIEHNFGYDLRHNSKINFWGENLGQKFGQSLGQKCGQNFGQNFKHNFGYNLLVKKNSEILNESGKISNHIWDEISDQISTNHCTKFRTHFRTNFRARFGITVRTKFETRFYDKIRYEIHD